MSTQIVEYSKTEAGLAELRGRLADVVYDVAKPAELDRARKDRRECVSLRTSLESLRVQLKSDVLERGRLIDGEARRIREGIEAVEAPIDEQIKKEETRKEAERIAKEKADAERIAAIRAQITAIRNMPLQAVEADVAGIAKLRDDLIATISNAKWGEQFGAFIAEAETARDLVIVHLENMHAKKVAEAEEAARIKAEREELARLRAEQEAAAAAERAKIGEEARIAEVARQAQIAADRVAREAEEAKARAAREAADAAAKVARDEQDRIAREAREVEARAAKEQQDALDRQAAAIAAAQQKAAAEAEAARLAALNAEREAAEAAVARYTGDARMAAFIELATAHKLAQPGTPTLQALVALCECFAASLPQREKAAA